MKRVSLLCLILKGHGTVASNSWQNCRRVKIWGRFDSTDMKKAKEKIGDNLCFWGNVSFQMLISGTPEQTRDYVKELIDTFGDNGGLIVGTAGPIPIESKLENVIAMAETVSEYGVY